MLPRKSWRELCLVIAWDSELDWLVSGLVNLADADLFFTDVGASTELQPVPATEEEEEEEGAAWQDSDDERMVVSLASVPRLRKLRRTEAEDVISGKDYVRRLRKQYADHTSSLPLNLLTLF